MIWLALENQDYKRVIQHHLNEDNIAEGNQNVLPILVRHKSVIIYIIIKKSFKCPFYVNLFFYFYYFTLC